MTTLKLVDPGLPEDPLDQELIQLARLMGYLPPYTDQEIESASRRLEAEGLPSLFTALICQPPDPFMMEWRPLSVTTATENVPEEAAELFARAARDGGTVTPEVETQMRNDRTCAEREQDNKRDDH